MGLESSRIEFQFTSAEQCVKRIEGSIAMVTGATIATRNLKHFQDLPIPVLNPFSSTRPSAEDA